MRISTKKIKKIINHNKLTITQTLEKAEISKTAYYSLLSKETVLPRSIQKLAKTLGVKPSQFLEESSPEERMIRKLIKRLDKIMKNHPSAHRENVWHSLLLLQEKPIERLNRGLLRAQNNIYR